MLQIVLVMDPKTLDRSGSTVGRNTLTGDTWFFSQ